MSALPVRLQVQLHKVLWGDTPAESMMSSAQ